MFTWNQFATKANVPFTQPGYEVKPFVFPLPPNRLKDPRPPHFGVMQVVPMSNQIFSPLSILRRHKKSLSSALSQYAAPTRGKNSIVGARFPWIAPPDFFPRAVIYLYRGPNRQPLSPFSASGMTHWIYAATRRPKWIYINQMPAVGALWVVELSAAPANGWCLHAVRSEAGLHLVSCFVAAGRTHLRWFAVCWLTLSLSSFYLQAVAGCSRGSIRDPGYYLPFGSRQLGVR